MAIVRYAYGYMYISWGVFTATCISCEVCLLPHVYIVRCAYGSYISWGVVLKLLVTSEISCVQGDWQIPECLHVYGHIQLYYLFYFIVSSKITTRNQSQLNWLTFSFHSGVECGDQYTGNSHHWPTTWTSSEIGNVTPLLRDLHWLPIVARIRFKVMVLAYKAVNGTAPAYL